MHHLAVINQKDVTLAKLKGMATTRVIECRVKGVKGLQVVGAERLVEALMPLLNPVAHVAQSGAIASTAVMAT